MGETDKGKHPSDATQCDAILQRLMEAKGDWVPMPELCRVSGAYAVHSRIAELRELGWVIPKPRITRQGKRCMSAYRLGEPTKSTAVEKVEF